MLTKTKVPPSAIVVPLLLLLFSLNCNCEESTSSFCDVSMYGAIHNDDAIIRTAYLNCAKGMLTWLYPRGSMMVHFSAPPSPDDDLLGGDGFDENGNFLFLASKIMRLCVDFTEGFSRYITVEEILNNRLGARINITDRNTVHCMTYGGRDKASLMISVADERDRYHNYRIKSSRFAYEIEEIPDIVEGHCGVCNKKQFRYAFCFANFVFRGSLMRQLSDGRMEYFAWKIIQQQKSVIISRRMENGRVALIAHCPRGDMNTRKAEYIVVSDVQPDNSARLLCAVAVEDVRRMIDEDQRHPVAAFQSLCPLRLE